MARADSEGDRVVIAMDPGQPVEINDLSGSLAALARVYERHYRSAGDEAPRLFVTRIETGSVILEIAPFITIMGALSYADGAIIAADFTNRVWRAIRAFSMAPGEAPRVETPAMEDAQDVREFVKPLLGRRGASLGLSHARYESDDGERRVVMEYRFDEAELNRAALNIDRELELAAIPAPAPGASLRREVMLFLEQAMRSPGKEKGRTGDKGVIPEVSDKPLPVYFRSGLQDLKAQMTRDVNPLTTTFVVDAIVQYVDGEPKGYIVAAVHKSIPGDDL